LERDKITVQSEQMHGLHAHNALFIVLFCSGLVLSTTLML